MKFDNIINEKYQYLKEADPSAAPQGVDAQPVPAAPAAPQAAPAPQPPVKFDKPYADLAQLLYKALRLDFDKIPEELQNKIHSIAGNGANSINSDEQGAALFKAVDEIVNEQEPVQAENEI